MVDVCLFMKTVVAVMALLNQRTAWKIGAVDLLSNGKERETGKCRGWYRSLS